MLKTPWKEWKDSAQNHYILFCFAPIVRKTPHILGFIPFKSRTFKPVRVSGLDVFDDVADRLPQMLVVLHVPLITREELWGEWTLFIGTSGLAQ